MMNYLLKVYCLAILCVRVSSLHVCLPLMLAWCPTQDWKIVSDHLDLELYIQVASCFVGAEN